MIVIIILGIVSWLGYKFFTRIDLTENPREEHLKEVYDHPRLAELKDIARRMVAQRRDDRAPDFEVVEKLKASGKPINIIGRRASRANDGPSA